MKHQFVICACWYFFTAISSAAEHRIESLEEPVPTDQISTEIANSLASEGISVFRGSTRRICDIWLCKQWSVKSFDTGSDTNYPFVPGQLIGVARYVRKGSDFRDQDIGKGVYTLRYAQQPVDGAHVGTSPTRDFLLLAEASKDRSPVVLDYETLTQNSAEAAGSSHPCLLSLQRLNDGSKAIPSIHKLTNNEWWVVRMQSQAKVSGDTKNLKVDLVVVGHAAE